MSVIANDAAAMKRILPENSIHQVHQKADAGEPHRPTSGAAVRHEGVDQGAAGSQPVAGRVTHPFFPAVESLRGIGTALVAAWHLSGWAINGVQLLPLDKPWTDVGVVQNAIGRAAVLLLPHASMMMFFVISGFVLRVSLQHGPQDFGRAAAKFHISRLFRLYPVVIAGMFAAALVNGWQLPPDSAGQPATPLVLSKFLANLLLLDVSLNGVLWAIQVELVMAPVLVMLYFLERRWSVRALVAVALITSGLSFANWTSWRPLSQHFFPFVLGMMIPTLGKQFVSGLSRSTAGYLLLVTVLAIFLPSYVLGFYSRYTSIIEGYAAAVLVTIVSYRLDLCGVRLLHARVLRKLGLVSASFYTFHIPFFVLIIPIVAGGIPVEFSHQAPAITGPFVILVSLAALFPLATAGYYLVEAPSVALGRSISRRLGL